MPECKTATYFIIAVVVILGKYIFIEPDNQECYKVKKKELKK